MPNKTDLSLESTRLLIWLTNEDLTFTKMGQRFNRHKVGHHARSKIVEELVEAGHATVYCDRNDVARMSKGGRPRRTLRITKQGKALIEKLGDL